MTDAAEPLIGVINAGSSSLKFSFYEGEQQGCCPGRSTGSAPVLRRAPPEPDGEKIAPPASRHDAAGTPSEVLPAIIPWAREQLGDGASRRSATVSSMAGCAIPSPARVTPELLAELEALVPLAPLHEPHNLAPIRMAMTLNPDLPQVACFDTAFHRTAPEVEQAFALPYCVL